MNHCEMVSSMRVHLLSALLVTSVLSSALPCPSGNVAIPSSTRGYLECTNETKTEVCGNDASCEFVSDVLSSKSQQICCISASLLCPDKQFMYGGQCNNESELPSLVRPSCVVDADCGDSAQCENSTCSCPSGHQKSVGSDGSLVCRMHQALQQQAGACPTLEEVRVNGQCMPYAAPGSQCQNSLQCTDQSACTGGQCTCTTFGAQIRNGYCLVQAAGCPDLQTKVNNVCAPFAVPGDPCQANEQCVGRATCQSSRCLCPQGTTSIRNYCVPAAGANTGNCPQGQISVNGACLTLVAPGRQCQDSLQCLDSSTCISQRCTCSNSAAQIIEEYCLTPGFGCPLQTQTRVNGECITFVKPGFQCQANEQCVAGSNCINQMCTCPTGRSEMKGYCVPTVGGGTGTCTNGQVLVNGICVNRTPLGGQCQQAAQCGDNTQCTSGTCQCAFGYQQVLSNCVRSGDSSCPRAQILVDGQCLPLLKPGAQCVSSLQCVDNSNCQMGMCTCTATNMQAISGYCLQPGTAVGCSQAQTRVNGQCVSYSAAGQFCAATEQCVGGAMCVNQQCTCPLGRYNMNGYCLVDATTSNCNAATQVYVNGVCYNLVQPGQQCQVSQQCIGGGQCFNFVCQNGVNNCPVGQVSVNGHCMNVVQPGGSCQVSQQCANNGQCAGGICQTTGVNGQCRSYQVSVSGQCYDTVSIGMQCSVQQQCIYNANCVSNRCQCNAGLTFNGQGCLSVVSPTCTGLTVSTNGQCLQLVPMRQTCSALLQCMGFSVCVNSVCACPYAYSEVNGVCRKTAAMRLQTTMSNCPAGQVMTPSGACVTMVGADASCQTNQQCPMGATCVLGTCIQGASSSPGLLCNGDPNKEVALVNGQPFNCQVMQCPADSQCEMESKIFGQYVCCRKRNSMGDNSDGYCPAGQSVELLPSGTPKNCLVQACSAGRVCMASAAGSGVVCCGSIVGREAATSLYTIFNYLILHRNSEYSVAYPPTFIAACVFHGIFSG